MIIVGVAIVALAIGFYLLVLAPKRDKASELGSQIDQLHASITSAEQQVSYGEQARQDFPKYYGRMVVLGKAVPGQSDTASLLVQLNSLADQSKTDLRAIALSQGGGGSSESSATPSPTSPAGAASTASTGSSASSGASTAPSTAAAPSPTATAAPATEATAAALPIGSTVGPAGLPILPYSLTMQGGYFDIANFIGKIDGLVEPVAGGAQLSPDGRLLTISGFGLQLSGAGASPQLNANLVVTAYSTGDQGLTLGASPSAPAPVTPGETQVQPASAVVAK